MHFDPFTGFTIITQCDCAPPLQCHPTVAGGPYTICIVPDAGGTADMPPDGCTYISPDDDHRIVDGLPAASTIEWEASHQIQACPSLVCSFANPPCDSPGGALGRRHCADTIFGGQMQGTGALAGYNRFIQFPVSIEMHSAPPAPGSVQEFPTDMFRLFGQIMGDPDFDLLRITGGTDFAMPSPGQTTLTQVPGGSWAVDSFFDITYRIDFVGAPGGPLAGMSGSTTGTVRMRAGAPTPQCELPCPVGEVCEQTLNYNPNDGSWELCCECVPLVCGPDQSQTSCLPVPCPGEDERCQPKCLRYQPNSGEFTVESCECMSPTECQIAGAGPACIVPDNGGGGGTGDVPPEGCDYTTPADDMNIIDGLPPATTIEIDSVLTNIVCPGPGGVVCSFPTVPGQCQYPGGTLGGDESCADSVLFMPMLGTGALAGFNRMINLPVSMEVHMAPRVPGDAVQDFDTDMFRLFGQIIGDPDFDLLRIVAGTDFGLPSPGHTTLTRLGPPGGDWAVDSFFDITYRIDFVGAPGSPLAGMSGSTTDTVRIQTPGGAPQCLGDCPPGTRCEIVAQPQPDGSIIFCCECVPCDPCAHDCAPAGGNGTITIADITTVLSNFGCVGNCPCDSAPPCGDGQITIADVTYTITHFGIPCP